MLNYVYSSFCCVQKLQYISEAQSSSNSPTFPRSSLTAPVSVADVLHSVQPRLTPAAEAELGVFLVRLFS
jgi:hypothetical protein